MRIYGAEAEHSSWTQCATLSAFLDTLGGVVDTCDGTTYTSAYLPYLVAPTLRLSYTRLRDIIFVVSEAYPFHLTLLRQVLETLVAHGAPDRILVDGKPHLGTDR